MPLLALQLDPYQKELQNPDRNSVRKLSVARQTERGCANRFSHGGGSCGRDFSSSSPVQCGYMCSRSRFHPPRLISSCLHPHSLTSPFRFCCLCFRARARPPAASTVSNDAGMDELFLWLNLLEIKGVQKREKSEILSAYILFSSFG